MSRDGCAAFPRGALGLSAVCDCVISCTHLLFFLSLQATLGDVIPTESVPRGMVHRNTLSTVPIL